MDAKWILDRVRKTKCGRRKEDWLYNAKTNRPGKHSSEMFRVCPLYIESLEGRKVTSFAQAQVSSAVVFLGHAALHHWDVVHRIS